MQAKLGSNDTDGGIHQMKSILKHGQCVVGNTDENQTFSENSMVKITVHVQQGVRCLFLGDLKDLESKVVLTAGSDSQQVATFVDVRSKYVCSTYVLPIHTCMYDYLHFSLQMLHYVSEISETLVLLQKAGHAHYLRWQLSFTCAQVQTADLQILSKQMDQELARWKEHVKLYRKTFYELNYFTAEQVLVLQRELKNSFRVKPDVLTLLHCVSPYQSKSTIQLALQTGLKAIQRGHNVGSVVDDSTGVSRISGSSTNTRTSDSKSDKAPHQYDVRANDELQTTPCAALVPGNEGRGGDYIYISLLYGFCF